MLLYHTKRTMTIALILMSLALGVFANQNDDDTMKGALLIQSLEEDGNFIHFTHHVSELTHIISFYFYLLIRFMSGYVYIASFNFYHFFSGKPVHLGKTTRTKQPFSLASLPPKHRRRLQRHLKLHSHHGAVRVRGRQQRRPLELHLRHGSVRRRSPLKLL